MKSYAITAKMGIVLTDQDIEDIMVTALEQGIGYWCILDNTGADYENAPKDEPVAITCSKLLLGGKEIRLEDNEEDEEYFLSLEKLLDGFKLWVEYGGDRYGAVDFSTGKVEIGNIDALNADEIIQYAIFSEIVFG